MQFSCTVSRAFTVTIWDRTLALARSNCQKTCPASCIATANADATPVVRVTAAAIVKGLRLNSTDAIVLQLRIARDVSIVQIEGGDLPIP